MRVDVSKSSATEGSEIALTTVVMAYNEADNLRATVEELTAALEALDRPYELLIIDDGSADATGEIADALSQAHPRIRVLHHDVNRGLGGVYRSGFRESRGALITFFPADGQFPAAIIPDFLTAASNADVVLGFIPNRRGPVLARALSTGERCLYWFLFGRIPRFQGILMFQRRLLETIDLKSDGRGWAVLMEFIIRCSRAGCRIVNRPTSIRPRRSGASKVNNLATIQANLRQVVALKRYL
jgi:glycosyltransferase involved in cell wall biosynthesis